MEKMRMCLAVVIVTLSFLCTYKGSSVAARPAGVTPDSQCITRWSQWINTDAPDTGTGDKEGWTAQKKATFCPASGNITSIECKTTTDIMFYSTGEIMTCTIDGGLECLNADNFPVPCSDYQIRYQCTCTDRSTPISAKTTITTRRSTGLGQTSVGNISEAPPRSTGSSHYGNEASFVKPIWRLLVLIWWMSV